MNDLRVACTAAPTYPPQPGPAQGPAAVAHPARRAWLRAWALAGIAACAAVAAPRAARARVVAGQTFAETVRLADRVLLLNGVGLRAIPVLTGYAAGLYLDQKTTQTAAVLANAGPKRLQLRMLLDVPAREFVKAVDKGIARNTPAPERAALAARVARFNAALAAVGQVAVGDVVDIDYLPGTGTVLAVNGRTRGEPVAGTDFHVAILRIFLGDRPVDPELKAGLLGGPAR